MTKTLFIIFAIAMILPSLSMADGPQYEVTINVVFNSVDHAKAAEIIKDAQERYGDACKVEIKSKKVSNSNISTAIDISDGSYLLVDESNIQFSGKYAFGDIGSARIACGDSGVKKSEDGEYYECKD